MNELLYSFWMLVGTYTGGESRGIYLYGFDPATARTEYAGGAAIENPSYLTSSADGGMIYAVSENEGAVPSLAAAFAFDAASGTLTPRGSVMVSGDAPCNIATNGAIVATANYGGGDVSIFGVRTDGTLTDLKQVLRLPDGGEVDTPKSHMHCVKFSPDGRYLFATDLGRDKILRWNLSAPTENLAVDERSLKTFDVPQGSGPRHFIFDATGQNLYLINELSGTVVAFRYNGGDLQQFQIIEADTVEGHGSADIVLSADGRWLYASNRLVNDGVAIFAVDPLTGVLTPAGYQPTGIHPRNIALTPGGKFLAVACSHSGSVEFYAIDPASGEMTFASSTRLDRPVCVVFVPRKN